MADPYKDFISGKGTAPAKGAIPTYVDNKPTPQTDYKKWISSGGSVNDSYNKVNISVDPTTRGIKISAPKYYIDSAEFKEQVLPFFNQLKGKQFTTQEFGTLMNSDMLKEIQRQAEDIGKRHSAIQEYKKIFPKATDDDALIALQNQSAAYLSKDDDNAQVITGKNADGTLKTVSVKKALANFNSYSDKEKSAQYKKALESIENPNTPEDARAVQVGLVELMKKHGALEAKWDTKLGLAIDKFLGEFDTGGVGLITNAIMMPGQMIAGKKETVSQEAKRNAEAVQDLEGTDVAETVGGVTGGIANITADILATRNLAGGLIGLSSKIPKAGSLVTKASAALDKLSKTNAAGKVAAATVREIPADLTFGASHSINNPDYNAVEDFAINTAVNAGMLSGAKIAGRAFNSIDTATNGAVKTFSENVGRLNVRMFDKVRNLPGIRQVSNKIAHNFIDDAAVIRRQLRSDWANKKISAEDFYEATNYIRWATMRGRTEATGEIAANPTFQKTFVLRGSIGDAEKAAKYVNVRQQLQRIEGGRYEMSDKRRKEMVELLGEEMNKLSTPEAEAYYQNLADMNKQIEDWAMAMGIKDKDIIEALRSDEAFKDGYITLQKNLEPLDDSFTQTVADRSLTNTDVIRRLTGPAKLEDLDDPYNAAIEKVYALFEINARNRLNMIAVDGIRNGNILGTITQDAEVVRMRNAIRAAFKEERGVVDDILLNQINKLKSQLNEWVEDVEDFTGAGKLKIEEKIDEAVNDMVDALIKDGRFDKEIAVLAEQLGGGVTMVSPKGAKIAPTSAQTKVEAPQATGGNDPTAALKAEALKYKSAEEFVNSQTNLLHGTKADFTEFDPSLLGTNTGAPSAKKGFFFTDTPEIANHYANPGRNYGTAISKNLEDSFKNIEARAKAEGLSNSLENNSGAALVVGAWPKVEPGTPKELVIKAVLDKMDSLKTRFDSPQDIAKIERFKQIATEELNKTPITELELFGKVMKSKVDFKNPLVFDDNGFRNGKSYAQRIDEAIEKGHDGVIIKNSQDPLRGNIYVALNKDQILTEKQLTDLYNQAHTPPKAEGANTYYHGSTNGFEEIAALGILDRNKKLITERLEESLTNTALGAEERRDVIIAFDQSITLPLDDALAKVGTNRGPLREKFKEVRRLNNEIVPSDPNLKPQAYYSNGAKGQYEIADPELQDYFTSKKTIIEENAFNKVMSAVSRVFRAGTTGLNPVFTYAVNPARDTVQSAVLAGGNVLNPSISMRATLEATGMSETAIKQLERELDAFIRSSSSLTASTLRAERPMIDTANNALKLSTADGKLKKLQKHVVDLNLLNPAKALTKAENALSASEVIVRKRNYEARFDAAIQRGKTVQEAHQEGLFYAANTTADFLNVGTKIKQFARTVPYLTAAINGQASFMRIAMLDPVGVAARFAAGIVVPVTYMTVHNLADPDRYAVYSTIPEYERQNNFITVLDDGSIIEIPMGQEFAKLVDPIRQRIEAFHGLEPDTFMETMGKFVLSAGPINLSGALDKDVQGNYDVMGGLTKAASGLLPQAFRPAVEIGTGQDLYTRADLRPSDNELYARGQVAEGTEIRPEDRTTAGADSQSLRNLSNLTGTDQYVFQNIIKNYTGGMGNMLLNAIDTLAGAKEERRGGKPLLDAISNRFFARDFDQSQQDFYRGLDELDTEKKKVITQLKGIDKDSYYGDQDAMGRRQDVIDKYGQLVSGFAKSYGEFYKRVGGLQPKYIDRIVKLLDLNEGGGAFADGTYQSSLEQDVAMEATADAKRRATDLGIPTSNERDRYGKLYKDSAGELYDDYTKTSMASSNINQRVYGTPKQVAYEFAQVVKGDKKQGTKSLYDSQQKYYDEIDKLYDQAQGLKGAEAQAIYSQISAIQEEYMTNEFDERIRPLVDKYGPEVLMNNKQIFEEIGSRIMVPGDFTPFTSRKKQPYQKDDVEAYLKDRYGVGNLSTVNMPTDQQVLSIINKVNADLAGGRSASAQFKLDDLQEDIDSGQVYVNQAEMQRIKELITAVNKRR